MQNSITSIIPSGIIKIRLQVVELIISTDRDFINKNDGNNDTVNGISFTENNTIGKIETNDKNT